MYTVCFCQVRWYLFCHHSKQDSPRELLSHISKLCMEEWQDSLDSTPTNKLLFLVKPVLDKNKPRASLCRCDETVITRQRIGHSRVTHSYLLSRESQPVCDHCKCHLTVKHMLLRNLDTPALNDLSCGPFLSSVM